MILGFSKRGLENPHDLPPAPVLPPATKLGQGYIFTGICDSVHGGVAGCLVPGGAWSRGDLLPGGTAPGGVAGPAGGAWWRTPGTATAAGGTHLTGMHSC